MQELWKLVSSPRHLLVFEAAARTGSFTRAADELNVQQPAVSASIKQLEASLGVPLFARAHRSVTLTHAGERLFNEVSGAFDSIYRTAQQLAVQRADLTLPRRRGVGAARPGRPRLTCGQPTRPGHCTARGQTTAHSGAAPACD